MKPYKRVLVKSPLPVGGKAAILAAFAGERIRIGDVEKEYDDEPGTETVHYELGEEASKHAEPKEPVKESESEHPVTVNKNGQNLELVKKFTEKFGKPPHHKAKDASIIEALEG